MSNAEAIRAAYRRAMDRNGEPVVIEAAPVANQPGPRPSAPTRARISRYTPEEVAGGITAANRKAVILHEDLANTPYPNGPVRNARLLWNGRTLTIVSVDNGTRRVGGVPIAYACEVSGA